MPSSIILTDRDSDAFYYYLLKQHYIEIETNPSLAFPLSKNFQKFSEGGEREKKTTVWLTYPELFELFRKQNKASGEIFEIDVMGADRLLLTSDCVRTLMTVSINKLRIYLRQHNVTKQILRLDNTFDHEHFLQAISSNDPYFWLRTSGLMLDHQVHLSAIVPPQNDSFFHAAYMVRRMSREAINERQAQRMHEARMASDMVRSSGHYQKRRPANRIPDTIS